MLFLSQKQMALPEVRTNSAYFPVSVKTCYCLDEPMTWLLRRLTGRSDLELDNSSCLTPISNGEAVTPSTQIKEEEKHSKSQQQPLIAST